MLRFAVLGLVAGVALAAAPLSEIRAQVGHEGYQPGTPFTYLFDTGSVSPDSLPATALSKKTAWTLVPEDDLTHKFRGDAVLLNDKLTVVLRPKGLGADVYTQTTAGMKRRVVLASLSPKGNLVEGLFAVRILENNPGAVMVEATYRTTSQDSLAVSYRLTTGQATLELGTSDEAGRLFVWGKTDYVVVPEFFGDDMVFGPEAFDGPRLRLPAENFLLNLLDDGNSMVMCVWESGIQEAEAILSNDPRQPVVAGCLIRLVKEKSLWVSFMEGPGIWHEQVIPTERRAEAIALDWTPPFAAKWRADFVRSGGMAQSWNFGRAGESGETPGGFGGHDRPCWFEADRACVRMQAAPGTAPPDESLAKPLVVYPIDRSRATPLTVFCPVDVLRNTLGVGPCQYVLQTEGLASQANPTPDRVTDWVEKQFQKKKARESAEEIRELLRQMTHHVGRVQARIEQYGDLAEELRAFCEAEARSEESSHATETLRRTIDRLERMVSAGRGVNPPARRAVELADEITGLIGRDDAVADCQRLGAEVRSIGNLQDRTLSNCRMTVRWLKQQARTSAARDPHNSALATKVRAQAERFLKGD